MSRDDILRRRFLDAEGQILKDRPPEKAKKIRWFKTRCPKCDHEVEYSPKENWDGRLTCPQCQNSFRLVLLDHFNISFEGGEEGRMKRFEKCVQEDVPNELVAEFILTSEKTHPKLRYEARPAKSGKLDHKDMWSYLKPGEDP